MWVILYKLNEMGSIKRNQVEWKINYLVYFKCTHFLYILIYSPLISNKVVSDKVSKVKPWWLRQI